MQYLSELPRISSISVGGHNIELELEQEIENLPERFVALGDYDPVVLVAEHCGQIVVAVGRVVEHKDLSGPEVWSRVKIKGSIVSFTVCV